MDLQKINLKDMVAWKDGNRRVMELRLKATKKVWRTHSWVLTQAMVKGLGLAENTDKVSVVRDNDGRRFLYRMEWEDEEDKVLETINKGLEIIKQEQAKAEKEKAKAERQAKKEAKEKAKAQAQMARA